MSDNNENWSTVIKPREKLLQLNLREVWDYRDLCSLFVRRNITHSISRLCWAHCGT